MSSIRKQTIFSSVLIYIGFIFGAINTYLFAKNGYFEPSQYGLVQSFISIGLIFFSFTNLGTGAILGRFYPYYYDELEDKKNDLLTLCLIISIIGFTLVCIGAHLFEPIVIKKFSGKSALIVQYYYWILPSTFFFTIFYLLNAHSEVNKKTVLPNFLREAGFRILVTILILLFITKIINFDVFIKLFAFVYFVLCIGITVYLWKINKLHFTFKISHVTKAKLKEMLVMISFVYGGNIVFSIAQNIDSITITSQKGLAYTGVFMLSNYIASIITVPQRSVASIASPYLAQAWKDGNYNEIQRIYSRSAINLLILSLLIFGNIWININDAYKLLHLDPSFETGKYVVLILGLKFIIDMGTGVNSQMLYTSSSWKFEFFSGILLLFLSIPLNYFMVAQYGILGAAYAGLIAMSTYNIIRLIFISKRYNMQPFSIKTIYTILLAFVCYVVIYFALRGAHGWMGVFLRSFLFSTFFIIGSLYLKLSIDVQSVINILRTRIFK